MDRMKNSDEIKELQEGETVRNWIKQAGDEYRWKEVEKYRQKLGERNTQK